MQKLFYSLLLSVACFACSFAQTNPNYYWSGKHKIYLSSDSTQWLLIPKQKGNKTVLASRISSESGVSAIKMSNGSELIEFTVKSDAKPMVSDMKRKFAMQAELTCKHLVGGKMPVYLTGDILLQPKKNVRMTTLMNLIQSKARLTQSTEYNTFVLKADKIEETMQLANRLYESGLVEWCHPDFWAEIVKNQNDPFYAQQYYLNQNNNIDINAPEAWATTRGCNNIRVAVVDDGVENHEDIDGRVLQGFTVRDANSMGAPVNPAPPRALEIIGHGQACAGIVAATIDNNLGVVGVAPNSLIIPINIFWDWFIVNDPFTGLDQVRYRETAQNLAASINWAWNPAQGNADIISNSWSYRSTTGPGGIDSDAVTQAITNARTQGRVRNGIARGCVVVFSSGNENQRFAGVTFPANVAGVITVGAIDRNGNLHGYSSRGAEMDLVAPSGGLSGDVVTTDRMGANGYNVDEDGDYTPTFNGTSAACPQVSGVAALMLSVNPDLTETQVREILQQTATDMGNSGFDNNFGHGRLNAQVALNRVIAGFTISGLSSICTTGQYSVSGIPVGATINWSSSNTNALSVSNTGLGTRLNNFNGQVMLSAVISYCGSSFVINRSIWIGLPYSYNYYVENINNSIPNYFSTSENYFFDLNIPTDFDVVWSVEGGILITPQNSSPAQIQFTVNESYAYVTAFVTNTCGSGSNTFSAYVGQGNGGGGGCPPGDVCPNVVFPNPAGEILTIGIAPDEEKVTKVELVNSLQQKVTTGQSKHGEKSIQLSVRNIPEGSYFIQIIKDNKTIRKQIIIKH
jgi:serine protease